MPGSGGAAGGASKKRPSSAAPASASAGTSKPKKPKLTPTAEALLKEVFAAQDALSPAEKDALAHRASVNTPVVQKLFTSLSESVATMVGRSVDKTAAFRHGPGTGGAAQGSGGERRPIGAEEAGRVATGLVEKAVALRAAGATMVSPFLDPQSCGVRNAEAAEQIAAVAIASAGAKGASFQSQLQLAQALATTVDAGALAALREHRRLPGALGTIASRAIKHRQTTLLLRLLRVMCTLRVASLALDRKIRDQLRALRDDANPAVADVARKLTESWPAEAVVVQQKAAVSAAVPPTGASKPQPAAAPAASKPLVPKATPSAAVSVAVGATAAPAAAAAAAPKAAAPPAKPPVSRKMVSVAHIIPQQPQPTASAPAPVAAAPRAAAPAPPPPPPPPPLPKKEQSQPEVKPKAVLHPPQPAQPQPVALLQSEKQPSHPQHWAVLPGSIAFRNPEYNATALDLFGKDPNPMDHRAIKPLPEAQLRAAARRLPVDFPFIPTAIDEYKEQNEAMYNKGVRDKRYVQY